MSGHTSAPLDALASVCLSLPIADATRDRESAIQTCTTLTRCDLSYRTAMAIAPSENGSPAPRAGAITARVCAAIDRLTRRRSTAEPSSGNVPEHFHCSDQIAHSRDLEPIGTSDQRRDHV